MLEGSKILIILFLFYFDLVIVLVAFLTQWDFFHHDKATRFLFLEGSSGSFSGRQFKTSMLGFYAT